MLIDHDRGKQLAADGESTRNIQNPIGGHFHLGRHCLSGVRRWRRGDGGHAGRSRRCVGPRLVDAAATRAARRRELPVQTVPASFDEGSDPAQAEARNRKLIENCDVLVAFWDGTSEGTRVTVERALDAGKEVHVYR